jgi:aldehyde dehydrogenase (NAD+)
VEGGPAVSKSFAALPFDHLLFTGSTSVGRLVAASAAKNLTPVTLELGGKSPAIIDRSADLAVAARRIAFGKSLNAGQTCIAPDYVLVQDGQQQALVSELRAAAMRSYGPESGWSSNPDFARLVDPGAFSRLKGLLDDAVGRGAKVVVGGESNPAERYLAPTVLVDVPEDAPLLQEEIFGPLLPVVTYRRLEDALEYVRKRPKPLALYLFTRSGTTVDETLAGTTSGGVCINNTLLHLANPGLPFGGVGPSGVGNYHGRAGFRAFSHERAVMRQQGNPLARWLAPPYTARMNRLVARFARLLE